MEQASVVGKVRAYSLKFSLGPHIIATHLASRLLQDLGNMLYVDQSQPQNTSPTH